MQFAAVLTRMPMS